MNPDRQSREFFGHPRGLTYLFATETWERFSYYGMRALLVFYLVKHLLPERSEAVIGLQTLRAVLETVFGPLAVQPLASLIYGTYTALVYFTPIIGGLIADRWLGHRRMVLSGAALMAAGHFLMAFESLLLVALLLLILGNGAFKPNISTQVGALYAPEDRRRDRAFSIFYVGINIGAFLAPLVCGTLGELFGWHYGFAAAGVGMLIGLLVYLCAARDLPPERLPARHPETIKPLTGADWRVIVSLIVLAFPVTFYWGVYEQQGNTIALWADAHTDRSVSLGIASFTIPATWFQAFNPFMIFAFTPFVIARWKRQGEREPSTVRKMALGCFFNGLAYLILVAAAWLPGGGQASWLWLAGFFAVLTLGELYLSPSSLSLVSKCAPVRCLSTMMGVWLAASFTGSFLAGYLGSFWSSMEKGAFFLMLAVISALAGLAIYLFDRPLASALQERQSIGRPV